MTNKVVTNRFGIVLNNLDPNDPDVQRKALNGEYIIKGGEPSAEEIKKLDDAKKEITRLKTANTKLTNQLAETEDRLKEVMEERDEAEIALAECLEQEAKKEKPNSSK